MKESTKTTKKRTKHVVKSTYNDGAKEAVAVNKLLNDYYNKRD